MFRSLFDVKKRISEDKHAVVTPSKYQWAVLLRDIGRHNIRCSWWPSIPIKGTASDVVGIFSATRLRNTVNERSMVTPEMKILNFESVCVRNVNTGTDLPML